MAICALCDEQYSDKRAQLGYQICLSCGELSAVKEAEDRTNDLEIAYNKGPVMYRPRGRQ